MTVAIPAAVVGMHLSDLSAIPFHLIPSLLTCPRRASCLCVCIDRPSGPGYSRFVAFVLMS
jgi:hypothetical protein